MTSTKPWDQKVRASVPIFDLGCSGELGCDCLERKDSTAPHGSRTRYRHYGCRCLKCTQANTDYQNEYNRKNKETS